MNKDNRNKTMKLNWIEIEWKSSIFHSISVQLLYLTILEEYSFLFLFIHLIPIH